MGNVFICNHCTIIWKEVPINIIYRRNIVRLQTDSPGKQGVSRISGQQFPFSKQSLSQEHVSLMSMLSVQFVLVLLTQHESNPAATQEPDTRDRYNYMHRMETYRQQVE